MDGARAKRPRLSIARRGRAELEVEAAREAWASVASCAFSEPLSGSAASARIRGRTTLP